MAPRRALELLLRGALLVAATGTAAVGLISLCSEPLHVLAAAVLHGGFPTLARLSFEQVLTGGCAFVVVGCALWLVVATGIAVLSEAARLVPVGRRVPRGLDALVDRLCPALVRTLVVTALGAVVTAALTAPAPADAPGDGSRGPSPRGAAGLSGLALPDRVISVPAGLTVGRTVARGTPRTVVVRRGDSLWMIAADRLPQGAGNRRICAAWRRLYSANKNQIGADPDLILPGTALVVPGPVAPRREDHS
ncbi:MAG TPA: hypothetical protein VM688_05920 [Nocardioidaceae bacterium]|nr:hypothetical protein [Nocardioidaceae bacterium]